MTNPEAGPADGVNKSEIHTDFMVGGPGLEVFGVDGEGNEVLILGEEVWRL